MATTLNDRGIATVPDVTSHLLASAHTQREQIEQSEPVNDSTPRYMPLSRTTDRELQILLSGDLSRIRSDRVAE